MAKYMITYLKGTFEQGDYKRDCVVIEGVYTYDDYVKEKIQIHFRPDQYKFLEVDDMQMVPGTPLDWYTENGVRYSDYELWLKGLYELPKNENMTFDENGNKVQISEYDKKVLGLSELSEGTEIVDGEIVPIAYYELKKIYGGEFSEFYNLIDSQVSQVIYEGLDKMDINFEGVLYQCSNSAAQTLISLASCNNTIKWRAKDNNLYELTPTQALSLASLMNDIDQQFQLKFFEVKDSIKDLYNQQLPFDEFILKLEGMLQIDLDTFSVGRKSAIATEKEQKSSNDFGKTLEENLNVMSTTEAATLHKKKRNKSSKSSTGTTTN